MCVLWRCPTNGKAANALRATETPVPRPKISGTRVVTPAEYIRLQREMCAAVLAYDEARGITKGGADICGLCVTKLEAEMRLAMQNYNKAVRPEGLFRYLKEQMGA